MENRCSCWLKLKRVVAFVPRCKVNHNYRKQNMHGKIKKIAINFANNNLDALDVTQIKQAERCVIKLVQSNYFSKKMKKKTGYDKARIQRDKNKEGHPDL